jgi:oligosaccharyltransferase complex subunit beta
MQSHSLFFEQLSKRGHDVSFFQAESPDLLLKKFGEYLYDNVIIFAPTIEEFNTITPEDILEFTNNGGNLLLAVNNQMSETMRSFAESCGVEFDAKDAVVIDHFQNHPSATNR